MSILLRYISFRSSFPFLRHSDPINGDSHRMLGVHKPANFFDLIQTTLCLYKLSHPISVFSWQYQADIIWMIWIKIFRWIHMGFGMWLMYIDISHKMVIHGQIYYQYCKQFCLCITYISRTAGMSWLIFGEIIDNTSVGDLVNVWWS